MAKNSLKIEIFIPLLTILSDSISIIFSFLFSYWVRFYSPFNNFVQIEKGIPELYGYLNFALITLPVWILIFHNSKMYRVNRNVFVFDEFFVIIKCVTIGIIFSIGILFFFREFPYSRIVFGLIWINAIIFIIIGRYFLIKLEKTLYNKGIGLKNVAVVGTNEMSEKIYLKLQQDRFTGFNVLGVFIRDINAFNNIPYKVLLGEYKDIPAKIREFSIEKILISLDEEEHKDLQELIELCEGINIDFLFVPGYTDLLVSKLRVSEIDGIPFMKLKSIPMNLWNRLVKRVFDIVFSLIFIILTLPFTLVISILIKLSSSGPVFYKQERVSVDGKKFMMYKFRSMRADAEKDGPKLTCMDDERYTTVGKYIRKYSIDEIPQFLNVLKGDLSIVGPRPEREFFINQMKDIIPKYLERHRVKCGITGWAQVNGYRGSHTSMKTRIDYDIYYIENWSIMFDIKIIIKTLREILFSKVAV